MAVTLLDRHSLTSRLTQETSWLDSSLNKQALSYMRHLEQTRRTCIFPVLLPFHFPYAVPVTLVS
ncbi:MAG: hypothetical protein ACE5R6_21040 [Candidatus Heimdallarchaeota archaeon]